MQKIACLKYPVMSFPSPLFGPYPAGVSGRAGLPGRLPEAALHCRVEGGGWHSLPLPHSKFPEHLNLNKLNFRENVFCRKMLQHFAKKLAIKSCISYKKKELSVSVACFHLLSKTFCFCHTFSVSARDFLFLSLNFS